MPRNLFKADTESIKDKVFRLVCRDTTKTPEELCDLYRAFHGDKLNVATAKRYRNEFLELARDNIEIVETSGIRSYGSEKSPRTAFWIYVASAGLVTGALLAYLL